MEGGGASTGNGPAALRPPSTGAIVKMGGAMYASSTSAAEGRFYLRGPVDNLSGHAVALQAFPVCCHLRWQPGLSLDLLWYLVALVHGDLLGEEEGRCCSIGPGYLFS